MILSKYEEGIDSFGSDAGETKLLTSFHGSDRCFRAEPCNVGGVEQRLLFRVDDSTTPASYGRYLNRSIRHAKRKQSQPGVD